MPLPGRRWRHVIVNLHGSWLHGDRRGFRSRGRRIESSGDYRNPPPPEQHEGLRQYHADRTPPPVGIPEDQRGPIGQAFVARLKQDGYRVLCASVSSMHAHALVELPDDYPTVKRIIGHAKEKSSRVANKILKGFRWAAGGTYKPVDSHAHERKAYKYILTEQGPGAWTWCFHDGSLAGTTTSRRRV